ncbi:hypothetical protein RchiOBHm_Chr2g0120121 [Rosa chinensis]|uniref:Uncharacterized protein n=2 Tax=Rosa TaxID=3764 RepID=A0A2P6RS79_ROSCH|nr:hypothetical protein RchiOBHm_Chr2g0120121 [Rosa chinensis]QRG29089.1 IDL4 [Rosa x burboniana]
MASCRRRVPVTKFLLAVWLFLTFIFILVNCSHGSRLITQQHNQEQQELDVFKMKPKNHQYSGHFLGFLPRRIPIPASGPSRKHNGIGLKAWRSP